MEATTEAGPTQHDAGLLRCLLEVGVNLSAEPDRWRMLDMILGEARRLERAEAGSLYILQGNALRFAAAQNDKMDVSKIAATLLSKEIPLSCGSLAGFVAYTGRTMDIPDSNRLPTGAPFRVNRDFDAETGYSVKSILAIPLKCPDGECVGVLELFNRVGEGGRVEPFPSGGSTGIHSLASMAAVTIHNALLQDQLKQAHLDSIIRLSVAAEYRDDDTAAHIRRISRSSAAIAEAMGLDRAKVELIEYASPMHDIGKIGIPDAILLKRGPLTGDERNVVQRHTVIGAEILGDPQNDIISTAREVALSHHERWDGEGYPNGRDGDLVPLSGRIVCLADVFDALMTKRCYKDPCPVRVAMDAVAKQDGKQFDPEVVRAFFKIWDDMVQMYEAASGQ